VVVVVGQADVARGAVVAVEDGPPDCQRTISRSMRTLFPI
jgi:hypothetical protein